MQNPKDILDALEQLGFRERSLVCVASDPGSLANFSSLSRFLNARGLHPQVYTSGWAASRPEFDKLPRFAPSVIAEGDIVCLGSRVDYETTREQIRLIDSKNATSVFFFDAWKNYLTHFECLTGAFEWPNWVTFPDALAQEMFSKALKARGQTLVGLRPKLLTLTHFSLAEQLEEVLSHQRHSLSEPVVLLDPISLRDNSELGYSCASVLQCAGRHAIHTLNIAKIVVKPHPRQSFEEVARLVDDLNTEHDVVFELSGASVVELVSRHRHIWGSTTVGLILAHWAKREVLSFQPGRNTIGRQHSSTHHEELLVPCDVSIESNLEAPDPL